VPDIHTRGVRAVLDELTARLDHIAHQTSDDGAGIARAEHDGFKIAEFHNGGGSSNLCVALHVLVAGEGLEPPTSGL
jgi:hypothetical protein